MEKYIEIRQENDMSKENEATEELITWKGMKHFERKYMTHTVPLSWSQMFNEKKSIFAASPLSHSRSFIFYKCV